MRLFCGLILFWSASFCKMFAGEAVKTVLNGNYVEVISNTKTKQDINTSFVKTIHIYFPENQMGIDRMYMDNANALRIIDEMSVSNLPDENTYIVITGKISLDGDFYKNEYLTQERTFSLKNYVKQKYPEIKDDRILAISGGEDRSRFIEIIEKEEDVSTRDQLLHILNDDLGWEDQRLKKRNREKFNEFISVHILHLGENFTDVISLPKGDQRVFETVNTNKVDVGNFDNIVITDKMNEEKFDNIVIVEKEGVHTDSVYFRETLQERKKPFTMVIKNNLIYDAILLPNLTAEIPFGRNYEWSLGVSGNWSWWSTGANRYHYYRIQMAGVELRRWFGDQTDNPLNGWFVGAYGYGGTYDIRLFTNKNSDKGRLSNWSYSAGLTFGYTMPISKRFNLEFGLGIGYFGGKYDKYTIGECGDCIFPQQSTHRKNYVGPTKANISLVWLIGDVFNNEKRKIKLR